jgi:hypothetical protein
MSMTINDEMLHHPYTWYTADTLLAAEGSRIALQADHSISHEIQASDVVVRERGYWKLFRHSLPIEKF